MHSGRACVSCFIFFNACQPTFICSHCQHGQCAGTQWWHASRALHGSAPEGQAFKQAAAASLERERLILECLSHCLLSKGPADAHTGAGLDCYHAPLMCTPASSCAHMHVQGPHSP